MAFDRFLVGPITTGLRDDIKPWLLPDDAFSKLNNAYVYEGRVRKRFGSRLMNASVDTAVAQLSSRLRINVGTTDANGDLTVTVPAVGIGAPAYATSGELFSVGTEIFTITTTTMLTTGSATVHTFNTATGALVINGADALTVCFFYPALPVMGITNYEIDEINFEPTIAFDTKFAYQYTSGAWTRIGTGAADWTGDNADFFWADNARGSSTSTNLLFVTNFVAADQIKYWDGSTWTTINPLYNGTQTIETARIIVGFKDRVIFLNTVETVAAVNTSFVNRCRFSWNGSPIHADAFREDQKGGYIDAASQEQIISAAFLKDRLIVFFERSTWELVYTNNEILPFRWQQINSELGVESTFSTVPFDKAVLGIGDVGIHACNGVNVQRIDQNIHHLVFDIHNDNDSQVKVQGIRDFFVQLVYWAYSDAEHDSPYNTHVLVFNYETGSWATNHDTFTAFGYHQLAADITWGSIAATWEETEATWGSAGLSSRFRDVVGGNQHGFVLVLNTELARNSPALQITDISIAANVVTLTVIDHVLVHDEFICIENAGGMTGLNDTIYMINTTTDDTITILSDTAAGTYTGAGTVARVSKIDMMTKQYNFYTSAGANMFISKVDFLVDRTSHGEITVDSLPSFSNVSLISDGTATGAILGTSVLETSPYSTVPLESMSTQLWHSVYLQAEGSAVQLHLYLSDAQMLDEDIAFEDFEMNAMLFYVAQTGNRLQ